MAVYTLEIGVVDNKGQRSVSRIFLPTGFTFAQYTSYAQDYADAVALCIGGGITGVNLSLDVDLSALVQTGKPTLLSDVEETAEFILRTAGNRRAFVAIPTYDENKTVAASDELDRTDADVLAFINLLEDGITVNAANVSPCDIGDDDVVEVVTALERFRNSGAS